MAGKQKKLLILGLFYCYFLIDLSYSAIETDTIFQGQELRDWQHLTSSNKLFKLKFFSPNTTKSRYLGIFYILQQNGRYSSDEERPVWVANRDSPIFDTSGSLLIDADGRLKISYDGGDNIVLSTTQAKGNASVTLLDNGNLVLRQLNSDGSVNQILWQSFDYPCDTLLSGMKLGINFKTGHIWSLTSWASEQVPASGSFTFGGDPNGTSQLMIWWHGNVLWTSGNWSNGHFPNIQRFSYNYLNVSYVLNEDEKYLTFSDNSSPYLSRYTIDSFGVLKNEYSSPVPFGQCTSGIATDGGCLKEKLPDCRKDDLFRGDLWFEQRQGFFYGYSSRFYDNESFSLYDCSKKCRHNCACNAYASMFGNGTGCEIWTNIKFETTDTAPSREIFVLRRKEVHSWWVWVMIVLVISIFPVLLCLCHGVQRRIKAEDKAKKEAKQLLYDRPEVQLFKFRSIELATNNFSESNKLGQGGFGQVYMGKLSCGREVAIKRLSRSSGQGALQFKNEIVLIANFQHTNLVRLLGCCAEGEEKIIVYEYMTNKSLDFFLFDCSKRELLNWSTRLNIIEGVAQGLLYLHKYSRLKVIHRDLKASNILLDDNMNPKISDFGMARIFAAPESEENTSRIVGTHGYMSPEYAMSGIVSAKTDVFSFGVLVLEIVSGKKNNSSYHSVRPLNLIGLAWELWREGRALELMDSTLDDSSHENEVVRCIHVGLLCVQDQAMDRPSMAEVVSMLTNDNMQLPAPKQPAFFIDTVACQSPENDERRGKCLTNDDSISELEPR